MPEGLVPGTARLGRWVAAALRARPAVSVAASHEDAGR
jgi:hypothetical protein